MDQDTKLLMEELLPIDGIGEGRAVALVEAGITLETLPTTSFEEVLAALKGVDGPAPNQDEVDKWKAEALVLLEENDNPAALFNAARKILNELEDSRAKDPVIQAWVFAWLLQAQVTASDPELEGKVQEAFDAVISGMTSDDDLTPSPNGGDGSEPPDSDEGDNGMEPKDILLVRDILAGNQLAYRMLDERVHILKRKQKDQDGELEPDLEQELLAAEVILGFEQPKLVIDPLFKAVQTYQRSCHHDISDHIDGAFPINSEDDNEGVLTLVAMYGIMQRENQRQPNPGERFPSAIALACDFFAAKDTNRDTERYAEVREALLAAGFKPEDVCGVLEDYSLGRRFSNALALAQAEYNRNRDLFQRVFTVLRGEDYEEVIEAQKWGRVTGTLAIHGVSPNDPLLALRAREALAGQISGDEGSFPSGIAIDLPNLEAQAEVEIYEDNLHAMQAIYFSAMLEDANVFQVRDALMNNFRAGLLPFGRGHAGDLLYRMIKETPNRLSEFDRRNLYSHTLGFAGGDTHNMSNRDFQMLWLRFVSAVSAFARQLSVDNLVKGGIPMRFRQEQVKKAGRDLAANLSLYAYGVTYFAATELQQQINEVIELLSDDEVKLAYGARDMWSVVEQVSALELGGPRDTIRYRTMAGAGAIIIRWLANKAQALADVGTGDIIDVAEILRPRVRPLGSKATINPFDSDLVNGCERWLAVTGTPEQQVEDYAGAAEGPVLTSQPVRIPSIARDMLESVGVNGFGV